MTKHRGPRIRRGRYGIWSCWLTSVYSPTPEGEGYTAQHAYLEWWRLLRSQWIKEAGL
jgi:hypothetical protein